MFRNLLVATALLATVSAYAKTETIIVDPATSKVVWLGKKVTGEHTGEVKIQSGTLVFDGNTFKSGEVTIDMTTITVVDITDKEYNKKLVDHLNSDDFFGTANDANKTAKLIIKTAKKVKGDTYALTGDLTIKGKTHPFPLSSAKEKNFNATITKVSSTAVVTFDRTAYDVKYNSGKLFPALGDKMIYDDVQLTVTLTAKK